MKKILFSILGAFMVSTMASAQYLNVKLKDGTYHSYKTSSKTEVSFGAKEGADVTESGQMIKIYHGDQLVTKYKLLEGDKVVYEEAPVLGTTGSAQRMGNIEVNWIQLWEGGPRFAEYNVGAEKNMAEDYGGYYCFGKVTDKDEECTFYNGNRALADDDDTATKLWGSNWRMPTKEELEALLNKENCTCTWTTQNGVNGLLCKGKEGTAFASNSLFLPAAGDCRSGLVYDQGDDGYYWPSTPDGSRNAYRLNFNSGNQIVDYYYRNYGYSVRAVLNENE